MADEIKEPIKKKKEPEEKKQDSKIHLTKYLKKSQRTTMEASVVDAMTKKGEMHTVQEWDSIFDKHLTRRMG